MHVPPVPIMGDAPVLVRLGPRHSRFMWISSRLGDNAPVVISYFYDGAAPVKVFQNRSQSVIYMDNVHDYSLWKRSTRCHSRTSSVFSFYLLV